MKSFIKLLLLFTFSLLLTACHSHKGLILFNKQPVTEQNYMYDSKIFAPGEKIYYLFIAPYKMKNEYIRVQVFKMTDKAPYGGYEVVRTKDFRLMKDQRYYHSDYFTLYQTGRYFMQVFSTEDFQRPLSYNDFYIK